jgi:NAD(P)H-dependent FMN reductase
MTTTKKIVVFAGSARKNSFNKKLAKAAADIAESKNVDVTYLDLANFEAPVYNGDIEDDSGLPASMHKLKSILAAHDGFIIATPEYNGHVPPLLVNCFSWASRKEGDEQGMIAFQGKFAGLMATSPGRLGGIRVLPRLRASLSDLGVMVIPGFVSVPSASNAFADDGSVDENTAEAIASLVDRLVEALG